MTNAQASLVGTFVLLLVACSSHHGLHSESMGQSQAIRIADQLAKRQGYQLSHYLKPKADFHPETKEWEVAFVMKPPGCPGCRFTVWVEQTGHAIVVPGE